MVGPALAPPRPTEEWADVGELRVRYLDWGKAGPPLIALHGLASSGHWYDLVAPHLCKNYWIVAPDQRGHGKTTQARDGYHWPSLASDLVGLMDRLGMERGAVVGHSWGAHVAAALAAYHPDRVTSLVMVDGGFLNRQVSPDATWEGFANRLRPRDVSGTLREFLGRLRLQLADCWSDDLERIVLTMVYEDEEGQVHDILDPGNHAQVLRAMWDYPSSDILSRVSCRTLIVPAGPTPDRAGTDFARLRREMVEAAARAVKGCRVHWVPNTIHDIGYHKPTELAVVVRKFLAGT